MVIKEGNFPYDISKFEKEAEILFPNEKIIVGAIDEADEELIQSFLMMFWNMKKPKEI